MPCRARAVTCVRPTRTHATRRTHARRYGAGSYGTLSNFFFLCSALFSDILHVRVMLVLAYLMLLLQVALGFPSHEQWTANTAASSAALGSIVWVSVTLALQLYGLLVLLLDELPARLRGDDELLWRLFYRRCGITKREFSHVSRVRVRCGWRAAAQALAGGGPGCHVLLNCCPAGGAAGQVAAVQGRPGRGAAPA